MAKGNRRGMKAMFASAVASQTDETIETLKAEIESLKNQASAPSTGQHNIAVNQVIPLKLPDNLKQPRRYFGQDALLKLEESIAQYGVLEPILVRPSDHEQYEIVSGERRWRCCRELGIEHIPAVSKTMDDEMALEAALIAHLMSENISPIEETDSILGLISLKLHQPIDDIPPLLTKIANAQQRNNQDTLDALENVIHDVEGVLNSFKIKIASFVKNRLPLLNLSQSVLHAVREGKLSPTNATLINRQPEDVHSELIEQADGLSKKELVEFIRQYDAMQQGGLKDSGASSNEQPTSEEPIHTVIFSRVKKLQRKAIQPQLIANNKVQTRLRNIQSLLDEIEHLIGNP
ncbi:MAG: ParB/RepB/Spo0J family partition protein [Cyanobacteria bacterium P01_F01_bin.150]